MVILMIIRSPHPKLRDGFMISIMPHGIYLRRYGVRIFPFASALMCFHCASPLSRMTVSRSRAPPLPDDA